VGLVQALHAGPDALRVVALARLHPEDADDLRPGNLPVALDLDFLNKRGRPAGSGCTGGKSRHQEHGHET
jgi:hypothetical protein